MLDVTESRNGTSLKRRPGIEYASSANMLTARTSHDSGEPTTSSQMRNGALLHHGRDQHPLVEAAIEHGALHPALARIALIGLEIEHVVDAVEREVVRDQEIESAHHEGRRLTVPVVSR